MSHARSRVRSILPVFIGASFLISGFSGLLSAQSLSVVSGDGVLVPNGHVSPLVVMVRDASGNPLAKAPVTWSGAGLAPITILTDSNGLSTLTYVSAFLNEEAGTAYLNATVTATYLKLPPVNLRVTTYLVDSHSIPWITTSLVSPTPSQLPLKAQAGSAAAVPVQVRVQAILGLQAGQGVPNVSVTIPPQTPGGPTIQCQGGTVFTGVGNPSNLYDANRGLATCTPLLGQPGTGEFSVIVGEQYGFQRLGFVSVPGVPTTIKIISGDKQTGNPGTLLPEPLVAQITDQSGHPLAGAGVTWDISPTDDASLSNLTTVSDVNGQVSAHVALGSRPGTVAIRVNEVNGKFNAQFTALIEQTLGGLSLVSGNNQTAAPNSAFGSPLVVQVTDTLAKPLAGTAVTFAVTAGQATLNTTSATTDANGQASVLATAGGVPGTVKVLAAVGTQSTTFNLSVVVPGPEIDSVVNGASFVKGNLAPGGIATIFGKRIAPGIQGTVSGQNEFGQLPATLAGVTVQFTNGTAMISAPIFNVSNISGTESVTVQIPFELSPGTVPMSVNVNGSSTPTAVTLHSSAPGIFETTLSSTDTRAIVIHPDGSLVTQTNPATRTETLRYFTTGLGQTNPPLTTGEYSLLENDPVVIAPIIIGVDNKGVPSMTAIYARNLIGVYEIQFQIGEGPSSGDVAFNMAAVQPDNSVVYSQSTRIYVQ